MRNAMICLGALIVILYWVPGLALASNWTVTPELGLGLRYDENFSQSETYKRAVYTYSVEPGLSLGFEGPRTEIKTRYKATFNYYDDARDILPWQRSADELNFVGHQLIFQGAIQTTDRIVLLLDNFFIKTRNSDMLERSYDPVRDLEMNAGYNALGSPDKREYKINTFTPAARYQINEKFAAKLSYRNTWTDYVDFGEDSIENRGILNIIYQLDPRSILDIEYQLWVRDYDGNTSDYQSQQVRLLYQKQFHYLTVSTAGGYQVRSFSDSRINDIDKLTYLIELSGQKPPAPERPIWNIRAGLKSDLSMSGEGDNYYYGPEVYLNAGYVFVERVFLDLWASYEYRDYETTFGLTDFGTRELRGDKMFSVSSRLGYRFFDFLTFSVEGGYENLDSNIKRASWENAYVLFRVGASRKFGSRD